MHQTAISTADHTNGADLGIRQEWLPLFDHYQVDLVVCGHEHHYERSHPVRGALGHRNQNADPRRQPAATSSTPREGTVHLVIGGGGTSAPSNTMFFPSPGAGW